MCNFYWGMKEWTNIIKYGKKINPKNASMLCQFMCMNYNLYERMVLMVLQVN